MATKVFVMSYTVKRDQKRTVFSRFTFDKLLEEHRFIKVPHMETTYMVELRESEPFAETDLVQVVRDLGKQCSKGLNKATLHIHVARVTGSPVRKSFKV